MTFTVKNPIPGFEDVRTVEITELDDFFVKLTTKERDEGKDQVSLTLVNPYALRPNYDFVMPTALQQVLGIDGKKPIRVYNVVILDRTIENSGVNFLAPIICNMEDKTVGQVVLDAAKYPNYNQFEKIGNLVKKNTFEVKQPILGFEDITKVEIVPFDKFFSTMKVIESGKEHAGTSFTLINPYTLRQDYNFEVPTPYQVLLDLDERSEWRVYNIVILNKTIDKSVVNFIAPVLCNLKNNFMAQVVLDPKKYPNYGAAEKISDFIEK